MAALLNIDVLRRHTLPPAFVVGLDAAAGPADGFPGRAKSFNSAGELARAKAVSGGRASRQPMRTRSRAIARSRRAVMLAGPPPDALHP